MLPLNRPPAALGTTLFRGKAGTLPVHALPITEQCPAFRPTLERLGGVLVCKRDNKRNNERSGCDQSRSAGRAQNCPRRMFSSGHR